MKVTEIFWSHLVPQLGTHSLCERVGVFETHEALRIFNHIFFPVDDFLTGPNPDRNRMLKIFSKIGAEIFREVAKDALY